MLWRDQSLNDVRGKGFFVAVAIAFFGSTVGFAVYSLVTAKTPGESHCYGNVCHRVYTLDETQRLIGKTVDIIATHYDAPGIDKYNVGQYTSSGEEFDASNPARAAASNYPDGTELLVWHPETKRAAHIRVNDFGPFMGQRTLDVTRKVAENMGFATKGVATLKVTVIWAQSQSDPNYKKARTYPASLGLIGIVEPHQYQIVVDRLIATSNARNRTNMPPPPLVALLEMAPPVFRPESIADAARRDLELRAALSGLTAAAPSIRYAELPPELIAQPAAPAFRPEAVTNVLEPSTSAIAANSPSKEVAAGPVEEGQAPTQGQPTSIRVAEAGPDGANRSTIVNGSAVGVDTVAVGLQSLPPVASAEQRLPEATQAATLPRPAVTIALARPVSPVLPGSHASLLLWIGIGLMLSTLWGAATLGRARRAQSRAAVTVPQAARVSTLADAVTVARLALERAEADARDLLARELAEQRALSYAEADAREGLARELAARDVERSREASMRAKIDAAAAAHQQAINDLAALEATRAARPAIIPRAISAPQILTPVSATAPLPVAAQLPPRAAANDAEMVRFPGLKDRALAGAVLGLPGARAYWGNTIIAQSRLDGTVKSGSALRVDGNIDGACYAPVVLISEGAAVTGMVAAETIVVLGTVRGILTARNIIVAASGLIEGEVYYQTMSIDPQAQCDVSFSRLAATDDPSVLGSAIYAARTTGRAA
jgi:cytoskeletal protein CcmA (bactofilin family)/rare lipoprotein A (peptidoglycan hydrolase)